MQTKTASILRTAWESVMSLGIEKLSRLTADELTRLSWAKAVESYDKVPEIYQDFIKTLLGDTSEFPYAVLTPTFEGFIRRDNEKLIFSLDSKIYILEKARDKLSSTCYPFEAISYVEVGAILLNSWIKIRGVASNGILTSSTLKFNSVTDYLFTPILEKIRTATDTGDTDQSSERAKFDYLVHLNFKFMNYARRSIVPGEKVLYTILQPEIRARIVRLFGMSLFRTISTSHLVILTDRQLIIIKDENPGRWGDDSRYGGIWNYIPLGKIASVSLAEKGDDLLTLSIHLPQNDQIDSLFSVSNKQEVELFLNRLKSFPNYSGRKDNAQ